MKRIVWVSEAFTETAVNRTATKAAAKRVGAMTSVVLAKINEGKGLNSGCCVEQGGSTGRNEDAKRAQLNNIINSFTRSDLCAKLVTFPYFDLNPVKIPESCTVRMRLHAQPPRCRDIQSVYNNRKNIVYSIPTAYQCQDYVFECWEP